MSPVPKPKQDKWNFHADAKGHWRWNVTTPEREVLRASAEAYASRSDAIANAKRYGYGGA